MSLVSRVEMCSRNDPFKMFYMWWKRQSLDPLKIFNIRLGVFKMFWHGNNNKRPLLKMFWYRFYEGSGIFKTKTECNVTIPRGIEDGKIIFIN